MTPPASRQASHPDFDRLRAPILCDRVRQIGAEGFGFLPHRFLTDGFLSSLHPAALALYVFLVLAANCYGVSFYGHHAICSALGFHLDRYLQARNALIAQDLIAFDGRRFQVLSLPERPAPDSRPKPLQDQADFEQHAPATIRSLIHKSFNRDRQ